MADEINPGELKRLLGIVYPDFVFLVGERGLSRDLADAEIKAVEDAVNRFIGDAGLVGLRCSIDTPEVRQEKARAKVWGPLGQSPTPVEVRSDG